eukprot:GHVP01053115.1.p1 GENE.GHVP01053115.1~~GHVP01053115.1.p1  ORF type:complete len:288 (-),score=32.45 GHVP01053115.1:956-1819(-)
MYSIQERYNMTIDKLEDCKNYRNEKSSSECMKVRVLQKLREIFGLKDYTRIFILDELKEVCQDCNNHLQDHYSSFKKLLLDLIQGYNNAKKHKHFRKGFLKSYIIANKNAKYSFYSSFSSVVNSLISIKQVVDHEDAIIEGTSCKDLHKKLIRSYVLQTTDGIVKIAGSDLLGCIYEIEDIEYISSIKRSIATKRSQSSAKPDAKGFKGIMRFRKDYLQNKIRQKTKKSTHKAHLDLEHLIEFRKIVGYALEENREKRDIMQERTKYGLKKKNTISRRYYRAQGIQI